MLEHDPERASPALIRDEHRDQERSRPVTRSGNESPIPFSTVVMWLCEA